MIQRVRMVPPIPQMSIVIPNVKLFMHISIPARPLNRRRAVDPMVLLDLAGEVGCNKKIAINHKIFAIHPYRGIP
jgi:hypothetical protein